MPADIKEILITSGTISKGINEVYTCELETLPWVAERLDLSPKAVFFHSDTLGGQTQTVIFTPYAINKIDEETAQVHISFTDTFHLRLEAYVVTELEYTGTANGIISRLLEGTGFSAGEVSAASSGVIKISASNRTALLNEIIRVYGLEVVHRGYVLDFLTAEDNTITPAADIFKNLEGVNIQRLEYSIDTSNVVTQLLYKDSGNDMVHTINASTFDLYPLKQSYREFEGDAQTKAPAYLEAICQPQMQYTILASRLLPRLHLGQLCNIYVKQLDISVSLRVIGTLRSLTDDDGDTYIIGSKRRDYVENFREYVAQTVLPSINIKQLTQEIYTTFDYSQTDTTVLITDVIDPAAVKIIQADVISASVAQLMNVFADNIEVEELITNQRMREAALGGTDTVCDFIHIKNQTFTGYHSTLSLSEGDWVQKKTLTGDDVFYVDVGMNIADGSEIVDTVSDPYKYKTLTVPHTWNITLMKLTDDRSEAGSPADYDDMQVAYAAMQAALEAFNQAKEDLQNGQNGVTPEDVQEKADEYNAAVEIYNAARDKYKSGEGKIWVGDYADKNGVIYPTVAAARLAYDDAHRVMLYGFADGPFKSFEISASATAPRISMGIGDGEGNGVGSVYKTAEGVFLSYVKRASEGGDGGSDASAGFPYGIKITDDGYFFHDIATGEWLPLGESKPRHFVLDEVPDNGLGDEADIAFVLTPAPVEPEPEEPEDPDEE